MKHSADITNSHQNTIPTIDQVNPELKSYIENNIFPEYAQNDWGHQLDHINYVIRRSFTFAKSAITNSITTQSKPLSLNPNILYTVAAYHDLGHHIDAAHHEKVSAEMLRNNPELRRFFSDQEITTIAEAIEDHRSHREYPPRSIYGQIVASADCNINIDVMLHRTYTYRLRNFQNLSLTEIINDSRQHLMNKYGEDGYAVNKMFFEDPEFAAALKSLRTLTADELLFRQRFLKVNHLEHAYALEQQFARSLSKVNPNLKTYIENNIFPQYSQNERAHGILHIREVIRRAFVLNDAFHLRLNPDMIYATAAYHDIGKHIDSDRHEIISAELFRKDINMRKYFSPEQINIIAEAIEDHRSSKSDTPRSDYGKLISSADRNTRVEIVFMRSFFVGKDRQPDSSVEDFLDYTFRRLSKRYSVDDPENMFYADSEYQNFLIEMRELLQNETAFKNKYCAVNQISSRAHKLSEEPGANNFLFSTAD